MVFELRRNHVLRRIKNYFKLRRFKKTLLNDAIDVHTISGAYEWIKTYVSLRDDIELSKHVDIIISDSFIETNYGNFANFMDAVHEASNFYLYGERLTIKPTTTETLSFDTFLINNYKCGVSKNQAIEYIKTHIHYFIDDLLSTSIDIKSTTVKKTELIILNVVALLKATLAF